MSVVGLVRGLGNWSIPRTNLSVKRRKWQQGPTARSAGDSYIRSQAKVHIIPSYLVCCMYKTSTYVYAHSTKPCTLIRTNQLRIKVLTNFELTKTATLNSPFSHFHSHCHPI